MDALESYALMLSGEHDPERLKKIVSYLEKEITTLQEQIKKCEKLKGIANERLTNDRA